MKDNRLSMVLMVLALLIFILGDVNVGSAITVKTSFLQPAPLNIISYQGQVKVDGVLYNGNGYFMFAILNASGSIEWSNDGDTPPNDPVELKVVNGLFNVLLGDISIKNMTAIHASVFDDTERYLRIWFSSDAHAFTQLTPDQRIAAVPYAMQAENAGFAISAATSTNTDMLDGQHASDLKVDYDNYIVVAKSGGDYGTISAALASITDASNSNRYLIKVMPGNYNEQVTMKPFVAIEGSGELTTKIYYQGSTELNTGTLIGADDAELRWLAVENTGGNDRATAIYNSYSSPILSHISVYAAAGSASSNGIFNFYSSPTLTSVNIKVIGSGDGSYGIYNSDSSPVITNIQVTVSGNANNNLGITNLHSSPIIRGSVINVKNGLYNKGIVNTGLGGPSTVTIDSSQIIASDNTITNDVSFTTYVGASLLSGGPVNVIGGVLKCAGVYDENYKFYPNTCP